MSIETVRLLVYYDGSVEYEGVHGIHYNQPPYKSFRISMGTHYAELVAWICTVLRIEAHRYILRLRWRAPTLHQKYVIHPIEEDEDVEEMLSFPSRHPDYRYIELYVFKEDAPFANNEELQGPMQCSAPPPQQELRTSVKFPVNEEVMPALQTFVVGNIDFTTDSRGIQSDDSAEDDDYWPEHDDSDKDIGDDDIIVEDDIADDEITRVGEDVSHTQTDIDIPDIEHHDTIPIQEGIPQVIDKGPPLMATYV